MTRPILVCAHSGSGASRRRAWWRVIRWRRVGSGTVCLQSWTTSTPSTNESATAASSSSAVRKTASSHRPPWYNSTVELLRHVGIESASVGGSLNTFRIIIPFTPSVADATQLSRPDSSYRAMWIGRNWRFMMHQSLLTAVSKSLYMIWCVKYSWWAACWWRRVGLYGRFWTISIPGSCHVTSP